MTLEKNSNLSPQICNVQYSFKENIESIDQGSTKFHKTVTFVDGESWEDIYGSPASIKFSEPAKDNPVGIYYEQQLILNYPGDDIDNLSSLYNLEDLGMIVKFTYDNGMSKIIGDKQNPAIMRCDFSTDGAKTGTSIKFTRKSPDRAFIFESS